MFKFVYNDRLKFFFLDKIKIIASYILKTVQILKLFFYRNKTLKFKG